MRQIGTLPNEGQARTFGDYLYLKQIENTVQAEENGQWTVWVHDDAHLDEGIKLLNRFQENPKDGQFQSVSVQAKLKRAKAMREAILSRNKTIDVRTQWHLKSLKRGRLTLALILISVAVALITRLGTDRAMLQPFLISEYQVVGNYVQWRAGLHEILNGQVWRLITPIFIHFGIIHLLFNMLWLKDLGTMIEYHQNSWILAALVIVIGVASNLGQYFVSGPSFGGMSGVVYGLLGYIWIRGKFDPRSGLYLHKTIVVWMIAWFVLCLTGVIGHVANTAHGVGLGVGMLWGYLSSGHLWHRR
jgi:GlpG protein